jgi:hypothetical protein
MPKQAKGFFDRNEKEEDDDRHMLKPAIDTKPIPTAKVARLRSAPTSIAGKCKDLAAAHHVILSPPPPLSLSLSLSRTHTHMYVNKNIIYS